MIGSKFCKRVAVTVAFTGMMFAGIAPLVGAATLKNNEDVNGFIRANSPSFSFRNESKFGFPTESASGDEYVFYAQQGDILDFSVNVEEGSSLLPVLVLSSQTGQQVAYDSTYKSLRYRAPTSGEYKLFVLGQNNSKGRYALSVSGLSQGTQSQLEADRVMRDVLQLRTVGCGVPNIAKIAIGPDQRCTRDIEPGEYVYDQYSRSVQVNGGTQALQVDADRVMRDVLQLRTIGCGVNNVAKIAIGSDQRCTRDIEPGEYVYDSASRSLQMTAVTPLTEADRVMQDVLQLRVIGCGVPNVAKITIGQQERCTRDIEPGQYVYDSVSQSVQQTDYETQVTQADRVMRDVLQLKTIGCGLPKVARISIGQEERCTRDIEPGKYIYDSASRSAKLADENRQTLVSEYGLKVLDTCPVQRKSLVVVSFGKSGVTTYCATPNRAVRAGEYIYNARTGNLDAIKSSQQCAVSVAGLCIFRTYPRIDGKAIQNSLLYKYILDRLLGKG